MAQLLVRGLSDETIQLLRARAERHGRSVEAEHRAILEDVIGRPATSRDLVSALQEMPWIGALNPGELRDNAPPREFHFDPDKGTTVAHARAAAGHDGTD